jgi:hypothetical protein
MVHVDNTGRTYTGGSTQATGGDFAPAVAGVSIEQRGAYGGNGLLSFF